MRLDRYLGWATPFAPRTELASLANELKHRDRDHDCVARRQGLCPGIDLCHDCPWTEGVERDGTHR